MNKPDRSRNAAFAQTWPVGVHTRPALAQISTVSTLRVKLIGSAEEASVPADGETRRYPGFADCIAVDSTAENDGEQWLDAGSLLESGDRSYQAMAFARTLPAIPLDELGVEESGIREIRRLQLWLHPRDSAEGATASCELRAGTPTLRVSASSHPLRRLWEAWEQQSPGMTILTATVLCVVSALAVSLFAN